VFVSDGAADPEVVGRRIMPLQIAVYRRDSVEVDELLDAGAHLNGTGDLGDHAMIIGNFYIVP
jgi:hypothetical protein